MIKIVTDTSASLPPDLAADLDIRQVPAVLDFGGQLVREQTDLTSEQLFAYLAEVPPDVPYVTVPSPSDFMAIYDQLIADAPTATIFSIHVSAQLNDTLRSYLEEVTERVVSQVLQADSSEADEADEPRQLNLGGKRDAS